MRRYFSFCVILFLSLNTFNVRAQQNDGNCDDYDREAMNFYYNKQYQDALEYMEKLLVCDPTFKNYYNASCFASLAGDKEKGFLYLRKSIDMGYLDSLFMAEDPDLSYLRSLKEWKRAVKRMAQAREKIYNEIAKINIACPASDLIPYNIGEKWGYLDRITKHKITEPIFEQVSFVGQSGRVLYGSREIFFTCSGTVTNEQEWMGGVMADYNLGYTSSEEINKGFRTENGKIKEYASVYSFFTQVSVNYGELYAIVQISSGGYSLIDSTGSNVAGIDGYKKLEFYNYGMDSEYFPEDDRYNDFLIFYIDSTGTAGIFNSVFEKVTLPGMLDFKRPAGSGFDREYLYQIRNYVYLKKGNRWGLWSCNAMKWAIDPEYDDILYTDRTYDGKYEDYYYSGNTIELYFLVKQNGRQFFIDKENVKYIPE